MKRNPNATITPETIADIRAALDVATPGEWDNDPALQCIWSRDDDKHTELFVADVDHIENANLICFLRNYAPALLDEIERLRARVAELEEKLRTQEYFDKNYTVIDDIGPLPKCFRCRHQLSMAIRGADAPCYHCRIADGYPKFEEDAK